MLTVNPYAACLFFFIGFLFAGCRKACRSRIFHTQGGNAAATAFDGAFGEDIADRHTDDDGQKMPEASRVFMVFLIGLYV